MNVLYFAQAAAVTGCRTEVWETTHAISEAEFWEEALRRHHGLHALRHQCRLAVDQGFLEPGTVIPSHSEVAVLPPVSGG